MKFLFYLIFLAPGVKDDAFLFKGKNTSFIEIGNSGKLDAKKSITVLANIYPTGRGGPIINYKSDGWGVHLWQFTTNQLFVRFVTRDAKMTTQPLATRVIEVGDNDCVFFLFFFECSVCRVKTRIRKKA